MIDCCRVKTGGIAMVYVALLRGINVGGKIKLYEIT